jgi:hypothetical protein
LLLQKHCDIPYRHLGNINRLQIDFGSQPGLHSTPSVPVLQRQTLMPPPGIGRDICHCQSGGIDRKINNPKRQRNACTRSSAGTVGAST